MSYEKGIIKKANPKIQSLMDTILATRFSNLDQDYEACQELLMLAKEEEDLYSEAFAYAYMGDCLIGKNESVNASHYLLEAKNLCEKYRFLDILAMVCNWLGIYYEMQDNRQMAMQYYLDALEFAEQDHDLLKQSILLNNIASQFQSCQSYELAKTYYIRAFERFEEYGKLDHSNPHYAQLTANIVSACCFLQDTDTAMHYLALLKSSEQLERNHNQIHLAELLIAAKSGDIQMARFQTDELFKELKKETRNLHQFFATFLVVANSMVELREQVYALKVLTVLDSLCDEDEYGHRLRVQYIWVLYYETFGSNDEMSNAYQQFYKLRQLSDTILNRNLADGLLSKIKLRESMKETEAMKKANVRLEDEVQLDELTQIYNRRSLRKLSEKLPLQPNVNSLALVMIDVDYFKQYNDTYGHALGDETLRAVGRAMKAAADESIYNFRYGGDEFITICINKTPAEVEAFVTKLTANLKDTAIAHEASLCDSLVTLSIGYTHRINQASERADLSAMMIEADRALYWAKRQGRNCFSAYNKNKNE